MIVQASDDSNTDTIQLSVTVTDVNDAPTVSSEISDATIDEDSAYSLVVTSNFADADGDTLTYTASGLPSSGNLAMSSAGTLSGTPLHADIGSYTVVVTATDDGTGTLTVSDTFTLTISNVNDAPSASAGSDQTPTEGDTVTLDASGSSDEDSDSLTYAWSQDSGTTMSLSDTTAASPTFTALQAIADYTLVFTVTVSDGNGGSDTDSVTITVSADNDAPSITSSAVTSATEDSAYSYTVETSDPESQEVTVSCTTCPNWLSISNGVLSGTPDNSDVGDNAVTLSATDGTTAVTQSFTIAVANVNSMGSVSLSGTTTEDQTLTATVSDPDGLTGVTISYQWQSTDSSGLSSGSWTDISGATSSTTYDLTQSEVGKYVRVSYHTPMHKEVLNLTPL